MIHLIRKVVLLYGNTVSSFDRCSSTPQGLGDHGEKLQLRFFFFFFLGSQNRETITCFGCMFLSQLVDPTSCERRETYTHNRVKFLLHKVRERVDWEIKNTSCERRETYTQNRVKFFLHKVRE